MTYREFIKINSKKAKDLNREAEAVVALIMELSGFSKTDLYLNYDLEVKDLETKQQQLNRYLEEGIPFQYILGYTYFYGCKIEVNNNVLIPRNDTEVLIEEVLKNIEITETKNIIDVCTGSGCIAIALKKERPKCFVQGSDISEEALKVAISNAKINDVKVLFKQSDILEDISGEFDILVANPPYIDKEDEVQEMVFKNEPHLSLFAEEKGLYFYREILSQSIRIMKEDFLIALEIGFKQANDVLKLVENYYPVAQNRVVKDLCGNDRVIVIQCKRGKYE